MNSIEYYDPVNWMNMSIGENVDENYYKAIKSISASEKLFYKLFQKIKRKMQNRNLLHLNFLKKQCNWKFETIL